MKIFNRKKKETNPLENAKVIMITSGKGGVGKTYISTELALYLQNKDIQTALLDLDIKSPNIARTLGLTEATLQYEEHRPDRAGHGRLRAIRHSSGLRVMSSELYFKPYVGIDWDSQMVSEYIRQSIFDINWLNGGITALICDNEPSAVGQYKTLGAIFKDITAIGVTTPARVSIDNLRRSIAVCYKYGIPIAGVICNNVFPALNDGDVREFCEEQNLHYFGCIKYDEAIPNGMDMGCGGITDGTKTIFENIITQLWGERDGQSK